MTRIADTIVAVATAPGEAALAIVRLSGPATTQAARRVLNPRAARWRVEKRLPIRRVSLCDARDPQTGQPLDEVMAIFYEAPRSYTGEDMLEIICHGGHAATQGLVEALQRAGARLAAPGEFTQRAFLNGKMDLTQAEAVADLIAARTEAARRTALRQLEGGLSVSIKALRRALLDVAAEIEARLDFPEEDIADADYSRLIAAMDSAALTISQLLAQGRRGRFLREGVRVAIVGRPNVGKSSLFNALLGHERALVTPHPGTTRDTIEATVDLRGLEVTLVDTAGVHETPDEVEVLGIERTRREIEHGDYVLAVLDASAPITDDDRRVLDLVSGRPYALVFNKSDLPGRLDANSMIGARPHLAAVPHLFVAAKQRDGLAGIEDAMLDALGATAAVLSGGVILTNARHIEALDKAEAALDRTRHAFAEGFPGELVMVDLREAITALGGITGESIGEEILDRIFSSFCIGK